MTARICSLLLLPLVALMAQSSLAAPAPPHPYRFDPRGGHPVLTLAGDCPPAIVTFRAIGDRAAEDRVLRTVRTAGGAARFEVPPAAGAAVSVALHLVNNGVLQPAVEYRALPPGRRVEDFRGDPRWREPDDWQAYWDRAKADLAKTPMNARVIEVKEGASETGRRYRVELDSIGGVRIVCWYTVPKDVDVLAGKHASTYPAVQIMPGYGGTSGPADRTATGYITLAVNPRGHGPSAEFWPLPKNHLEEHINDPQTYYYRSAYMDCLRAMQFLRGRPEVDQGRVATEGSSQGGALSLVTAALDGRVAACGAYVPFLSDLPTAVRMCTNGGYQGLRLRFEDPASPVRTSMSYVDARFMAARVKCPTLITIALMDRTCPPATGYADFNALPGTRKKLFLDQISDHQLTDSMAAAVSDWFDRWLK